MLRIRVAFYSLLTMMNILADAITVLANGKLLYSNNIEYDFFEVRLYALEVKTLKVQIFSKYNKTNRKTPNIL